MFKNKTDNVVRTVKIESNEEITDCDGNEVKISASRTRSSSGYRSIQINFGKAKIEFNSDLGDNYEQAARVFAALLEEISNEPCILPE